MTKPRVTILGLGVMGSGMAGRLLSEKFPLTVYNRGPEKAAAFAAAGAFVAPSPRQAAARSEVVLSMVSDDDASRAVWLGKTGDVDVQPVGLQRGNQLPGGGVDERLGQRPGPPPRRPSRTRRAPRPGT